MADTTFTAGTVVTSSWLNDVNDFVYKNVRNAKVDGATGDGVTDDSPYISASIALLSAAGGGTLYIPAGTYKFNSTVKVTTSNIRVVGEGAASLIVNGQTSSPALQFGDSSAGATCYRNAAIGLAFASASGVVGVSGQIGLYVRGAYNMLLMDINGYQFPNPLYDTIVCDNSFVLVLDAVQVQNSLHDGITFRNNCGDVYATALRSDANGNNGITIKNSNGLYFTNSTAYANTQYAWHIAENGTSPSDNNNHFYVNCIGDTSGNHNWLIENLRRGLFTNCWGSTQQSNAVNTSASGFVIFPGASGVKNIHFNNCLASYNNANGFSLGTNVTTPANITYNECIAGDVTNPNGQSGAASGFLFNAGTYIKLINSDSSYNIGNGITIASGVTGIAQTNTVVSNTVTAISNSAPTTFTLRGNKGYQPAVTNNTAGTSPWTSTALPYDCLFSTTLVGGMTALVKNGDGYTGWSLNQSDTYQGIFLKAGETITATWVTTAPQFSFGPCQ